MKKKLFLSAVFTALLCFSSVKAQTDVTNLYLINAGFDSDFNYDVDATESLAAAGNNALDVYGWTKEDPATGGDNPYGAGAIYQYGTAAQIQATNIPAVGSDGTAAGGALGLTSSWSGNIAYNQELIDLPAGKYALEYVVVNVHTTGIAGNRSGWIPFEGNGVYSSKTTFAQTWETDRIEFTLTEISSGKLQLGLRANANGSANTGRLVIDYVKLLYYGIDKTDLNNKIADAELLYGDGSGKGAAALKTAIDAAKSLASNDNVTMAQVVGATAELDDAIFDYQLQSATKNNPLNVTRFIVNPDFETNGVEGWTTDFTSYTGANTLFTGASNPNVVMDGDGEENAKAYQTISNLPGGVYRLTAVARGSVQTNGEEMYIGLALGDDFSVNNMVSVLVNRIGDSGGDLNFGWNKYQTPEIVVTEGGSLTLGMYTVGDCGWSSVDDFRLSYYTVDRTELDTRIEVAETLLPNSNQNALKVAIDAAKTASNVVEGLAEINAAISAYERATSALETAKTALVSGTPGENYVKGLVSALESAMEETGKTISEVATGATALNSAIAAYQNTTLSALLANNISVSGFSATTYNYLYYITKGTTNIPVVSATAAGAAANATVVITQASAVPGMAKVVVTAGNGSTQTYKINFTVDHLVGWDDSSKGTPQDAGWEGPVGNEITWGSETTTKFHGVLT